MKSLLIISMVVASLVIAPLNRIQKTNHTVATDSIDQAAQEIIRVPDLISLGTIAAANQGPYFISGYQHPQCPGSIAILPLYRNAEGGQILKQLIRHEGLRYGVLFKGNVHFEFPQFAFAMEKLWRGIRFIGQKKSQQPIKALAFAEQGECELAEKLARYTL